MLYRVLSMAVPGEVTNNLQKSAINPDRMIAVSSLQIKIVLRSMSICYLVLFLYCCEIQNHDITAIVLLYYQNYLLMTLSNPIKMCFNEYYKNILIC